MTADRGPFTSRSGDAGELRRFASAGFMTNLCARLFERLIAERIRNLGLTPAYLPIIFMLSDAKEATQAELVNVLAVRQPTMAQTLRRMERDGLLERLGDPNDRRVVRYSLTQRAIERISELAELVDELNAKALAGLTVEQRDSYMQSVGIIIATLNAMEQQQLPPTAK